LADGRTMEMPACIVFEVKGGLVTRIDEYLNPEPAIALRSPAAAANR
jgi:hypothetical protein